MSESTRDHWSTIASSAQETANIGISLALSLYRTPVTLLLSGDLGAGKTTFIQGLARGLRIDQPVVSPTFALEQRVPLPHGSVLEPGNFVHIDLYRITPKEALRILAESEDDYRIRCIEWPERLPSPIDGPLIRTTITEEGLGRRIVIDFDDLPLPSPAQIEEWRKEVALPENIIRHTKAVTEVADRVSRALMDQGRVIRPLALHKAAELHDLLRFVDFRLSGTSHEDPPGSQAIWHDIANRYPGASHEEACAQFLAEQGFPELGKIIAPHGLTHTDPLVTIEQKALYYADKRAAGDRFVTMEERFRDFNERYSNGQPTPQAEAWYASGRKIEAELFPAGPPF